MGEVRGFKDLIVWQKAIVLVKEAYLLIKRLPKEENYALAAQMRRAAVSISPLILQTDKAEIVKKNLQDFFLLHLVLLMNYKHNL